MPRPADAMPRPTADARRLFSAAVLAGVAAAWAAPSAAVAQDLGADLAASPVQRGLADGLAPAYLQAEPGQSAVGTIAYDDITPPWYARGGVALLFPQDVVFEGVTSEPVVNTENPDAPDAPAFIDETVDQDVTLGWGGGLWAAVGYGFAPDGRVNPRVEAEYQLLLADFRDADRDGITWNSLGVNGILEFPLRDSFALYGGVGGGITYISFDNPAALLSDGTAVSIGSDDAFTFYVQALGGALFRFSDDIDVDLGLRYQVANPDAYEGDTTLDNVIFHVGLLLHLE